MIDGFAKGGNMDFVKVKTEQAAVHMWGTDMGEIG